MEENLRIAVIAIMNQPGWKGTFQEAFAVLKKAMYEEFLK